MFQNTVKDIFSSKLIAINRGEPVSKALEMMRNNSISCIPVLNEGKPVGIFTERSITRYAAKKGLDFFDLEVEELMSSPVLTVTPEAFLYDAYGTLITNKIRHLVVVDNDGLALGVITLSNVIANLSSEHFLDIKKVSQIMSRTIATAEPGASVREALNLMDQRNISCLIVTNDQIPLGIITERDVNRFLCEAKDIDSTPLESIMSTPVLTVDMDTPVYEAAQTMKFNKVRRLVAVDPKTKRIAGLTTQTDILRGLEGKYIDALQRIVREKDSALRDTLQDLHKKTIYLDNILRSSIDLGIIATDLNFRVVYYNPAAESIMGLRSEEVIGQDVRKFHFRENIDLAPFNRAIEVVRNRSQHTFTFDRYQDNTKLHIQARASGIWDTNDNLVGFVLMLQDITERRKAEETIQYMAYHDNLTGLPNRILFNDRFQQELNRCRRNRNKLAVMVIDLDYFKNINDTYGHHAGDILLKSIGLRLSQEIRESDTVARMGGDEFLMVMPEIFGVQEAVSVAERLIQAMEEPLEIEGIEIAITASVGIAFYPDHGEDPDKLIRKADKAMYRAKEQNRSNHQSNVCSLSPGKPE